jgi:hypothetical protein
MIAADLYVGILPDISRFGSVLDRGLSSVGPRSGAKLGRTLGTRIEQEAARATPGRFLANPNLQRSAAQAGLRIGKTLAMGVAKQMAGTIVQRAGTALGNKLYEKAAAKLKGSRWETALKNPKILAAAGAVGLLVGRKIAQRASAEARSGIKLDGVGAKIGGQLKSGILSRGAIGGLGGIIASLIGGAVITGAKSLAEQASNFNETVSKSRNIFGSSAKSIENWSKRSATSMGLAQGAALEGAASFGNLFDQLKIGQRDSVRMSKGFLQMAADAASFNNADPSEVMDAFLAATRGEYDALQRFVPTASAAAIQAQALSMGLGKASKNQDAIRAAQIRASVAQSRYNAAVKEHGARSIEARSAQAGLITAQGSLTKAVKGGAVELSAADKVQALYALSVKDMGKAHGDFARTSGGFANQQRIMAANWQNLKVQIGQYFLPIFTRAAVYANTQGFPAFKRIVRVAGELATSAGRMGRAMLGVFSNRLGEGIDKATINLQEIADWLETHQEDMVRFFIRLGDGAIAFGRATIDLAANAVRAYGRMAGGLADFIDGAVPALQGVLTGIADIVMIFDRKAAKSIRDGAAKLGEGGKRAAEGLRKTNTSANQAADAMNAKFNPIFDEAGRKLHEVGNAEIWKAKQRDQAAKASQAIRDIGTQANGSQIKLKTWNDRTKLGSTAQAALETRIKAARERMIDQWRTGEKAGDVQAALTKRWDKGKDALYREFRQMGLSKAEAQRLTEKYGKIPKKAETKVTQPGMSTALTKTKNLDDKINDLNSKKVTVEVQVNAGLNKLNRALVKQYGRGAVKMAVASGGVLPGWSPGRDIHTFTSPTGGQLALSGGEAVMVPEWTAQHGGPKGVARENARAKQALAGGGTIGRQIQVDTRLHGSTYDYTALRNIASNVSRDAYRSAISDMGHQATSAAAKAAVAAAKAQKKAASSEGYDGPLPGGHGAAGIKAIARALGASYIAAHRDPQGGPAFDLGSSGARNDRIARALISKHSALGLRYVIHQMQIASARSSWHERAYSPITNQGDFRHVGHVHVSYDNGGILPPGLTMAYNGTGKNEVVTPAEATNGRPITILIDLGDGLTQRVEGIIDENEAFHASVRRSRG